MCSWADSKKEVLQRLSIWRCQPARQSWLRATLSFFHSFISPGWFRCFRSVPRKRNEELSQILILRSRQIVRIKLLLLSSTDLRNSRFSVAFKKVLRISRPWATFSCLHLVLARSQTELTEISRPSLPIFFSNCCFFFLQQLTFRLGEEMARSKVSFTSMRRGGRMSVYISSSFSLLDVLADSKFSPRKITD